MQDHLDGWYKSSHRSVATCNDCHTPAGFVPKYFTKAEHGFFHSLAFTTGDFHDPIQIKERSRRVTENSCRKCHQDIVHDIDLHQRIRRHHVLHSLPRECGPSEIETL